MEWVQADPLQAADPAAWTVIHRDDPFDVREVFGHGSTRSPGRTIGTTGAHRLAREHMRPCAHVLYLGFIFGVRHFMHESLSICAEPK